MPTFAAIAKSKKMHKKCAEVLIFKYYLLPQVVYAFACALKIGHFSPEADSGETFKGD
jgi:hypothetical protein